MYVDIKKIRSIELDDLDLCLRDDFEFDYSNDNEAFVELNRQCVCNEVIKIDTLVNALNTLIKDGCNYVDIDFHCDHISYIINGLTISLSKSDDIKDYLDKKIDMQSLNTEIDDLQCKLEILKKKRLMLFQ